MLTDLGRADHSRPVRLDAATPGGASVQGICVQGCFLVLDGEPDKAWRASGIAGIISSLLRREQVGVPDPGLRKWLMGARIAKLASQYGDAGPVQDIVLGDGRTAQGILRVLSRPEEYD